MVTAIAGITWAGDGGVHGLSGQMPPWQAGPGPAPRTRVQFPHPDGR
jgi:hypothetical protein